MVDKKQPVLRIGWKDVRWIVPLKRGKLTDTKENQKLNQNIWIGWEVMYMDGTSKNIVEGEFKTLSELRNHNSYTGEELWQG